jgi:hypothetical protein
MLQVDRRDHSWTTCKYSPNSKADDIIGMSDISQSPITSVSRRRFCPRGVKRKASRRRCWRYFSAGRIVGADLLESRARTEEKKAGPKGRARQFVNTISQQDQYVSNFLLLGLRIPAEILLLLFMCPVKVSATDRWRAQDK